VLLVVASSYLLVPLSIVPQATCQRRMDYKSNTMIEVGSSIANAAAAVTLAVLGHGALALAWGPLPSRARLVVSQWRAGLMLPWPLRLKGARPVLELGGPIRCSPPAIRSPRARRTGHRPADRQHGGRPVRPRLWPGAATAHAGGGRGDRRVLSRVSPRTRQGEPLGPPYLRVVAAYTGVTWPAMAGIATLAQPLILALYGPRWLAAAPLLPGSHWRNCAISPCRSMATCRCCWAASAG
jgi:hypothetical protein